jgi:hypothetical protein
VKKFKIKRMNNNGNFNNGPPNALMSYPFPMHNPPQHPPLMEQTYMNQVPQHFQPHAHNLYNPRPTVCLNDFTFNVSFLLKNI